MKDLILVINQLQDVFTATGVGLGLELPEIAVVGGQSAGKSSVLENFVGKDFLPRGNGIVTRRPLVLQLIHNPIEEYAQFLHKGDNKFWDFDMVRKEIEAETDRETGYNKGISNKPINLRVYSPHVLNLTLIDLPGLTKVAVGDQPEDIENQIKSMLMQYITRENTIILAVTPANQDLANSDALKLAREVDRDGQRTIGVITKLDLMDAGTDAREIFEGKLLPLSRGYTGVVNRSQLDIDNKKDIRASLDAEREFLEKSPYKHLMEKMGTKFLQQHLNESLKNHIKEKLPGIRSDLKTKQKEINTQLKQLGHLDTQDKDKVKILYSLIEMFKDHLHSSIEGNSMNANVSEIKGGAIINTTFYTEVYNTIAAIDTTPDNKEIARSIANLHGFRNAMFAPELAFPIQIKLLVELYKEPLKLSVAAIKNILTNVVQDSSHKLDNYPMLKDEVVSLLCTKMEMYEDNTVEHLYGHIEAQKSFPNTKHPEMKQFRHKLDPNNQEDEVHNKEDIIENIEGQELCGGSLTLMTSGFRGSKSNRCSITMTHFLIYSSKEDKISQRVSLKNVTCDSAENKKKARRYVLYRQDNQPLYKTENRLELEASKDDSDVWTAAFQKAGIFVDLKGSLSSLDRVGERDLPKRKGLGDFFKKTSKPHTEKEFLKNKDNMEQTSLIHQMVTCYMKIVDTTIQDMVPKYIIYSLVQATLQYAKLDLLGDLLSGRETQEEKEELMDGGSDEAKKIAQLLVLKDAMDQAINILTDISTKKM